MSKLHEKLKASVKPAQGKSAPVKPASSKAAAPPKPAKAVPNEAHSKSRKSAAKSAGTALSPDLNSSSSPLFPKRIWPD